MYIVRNGISVVAVSFKGLARIWLRITAGFMAVLTYRLNTRPTSGVSWTSTASAPVTTRRTRPSTSGSPSSWPSRRPCFTSPSRSGQHWRAASWLSSAPTGRAWWWWGRLRPSTMTGWSWRPSWRNSLSTSSQSSTATPGTSLTFSSVSKKSSCLPDWPSLPRWMSQPPPTGFPVLPDGRLPRPEVQFVRLGVHRVLQPPLQRQAE